jgi:hypothetical protein
MPFLSQKPGGTEKRNVKHRIFGHLHRPDLGAIEKIPHKELGTDTETNDQIQSRCHVEHRIDGTIEDRIKFRQDLHLAPTLSVIHPFFTPR